MPSPQIEVKECKHNEWLRIQVLLGVYIIFMHDTIYCGPHHRAMKGESHYKHARDIHNKQCSPKEEAPWWMLFSYKCARYHLTMFSLASTFLLWWMIYLAYLAFDYQTLNCLWPIAYLGVSLHACYKQLSSCCLKFVCNGMVIWSNDI